MLTRKPVVAGYFYESGFERLDRQIFECFISKRGPGDSPVKRGNAKVTHGVVSPHAGYQFSGPAAAWAHKDIAESKFPSRFIIIGPNHTGMANARVSTTLASWETPLGTVEADREFIREIIKSCDLVKDDYSALSQEHSIEVQIPFLQFANKDRMRDLRIVPLVVSYYDLESCKTLADTIAGISEEFCVIASSDFTHYGPNYGYTPFFRNKKENMYSLDGKAIDFIKSMDTKGFLEYVDRKRATICGAGAIALCMELMKNLGVKKSELLNYYTSGDVVNDYENMVGYAAIKF
ncbi:AmmeMemoRadiSam system protein B [Candidatus Woesearchaeota archaeon]|nr:AmmeMemoRadiSam system protein B [Candidatus Woesearchaeota archaeon]